MASDVGICNKALLALGARTLLSLSDDSTEGRLANRTYPDIRDDFLQAHPWNFAIKRASLAASATAPAWEFTNAYPVPIDSLRILEIETLSDHEWRVENTADGTVIVTDHDAPINIRYIARITNADLMPPSFREALSSVLAAEWAQALTGDADKVQLMDLRRIRKVAEARALDGQEQSTHEAFEAFTWTGSRV